MKIPTPSDMIAVRSAVTEVLEQMYVTEGSVSVEVGNDEIGGIVERVFRARGWETRAYRDENEAGNMADFVMISPPDPAKVTA